MGQFSKATLASLPLRYSASFGILLLSARKTSTWRSKVFASLPRILTILVEGIYSYSRVFADLETSLQTPAESGQSEQGLLSSK
eukprot:5469016-Pyramimonas_sp.AAC.1